MGDLYSRYIQLARETGKLAGLSFELTNYCNFNCTHCYRIHGSSFLSEEIFHKALHEAEELGVIFVSFNGGEPTWHPKFVEFALAVLQRGMHLSVLTNGSGLTDSMLDALSAWKGIHFQFSIYGYDTSTGAKITGTPDAFDKALQKIFILQQRGFDLRVSLLALNETADGLDALVALLLRSNIKIGLMPLLSAREDGDRTPIHFAAGDRQLEQLLKYEGIWSEDVLEPIANNLDDPGRTSACSAAQSSLGISVGGDIMPCQVLSRVHFGNITNNTLNASLNSDVRKSFLEANVIPPACGACKIFSTCFRCPGEAVFETGSLTGIPPESCRIARLRSKMRVDSH